MKKPIISMIAAIGKNRELGKDNKLLWHIPEDLKRFKRLTEGHVVIMGRKTFESIGKPLPNRINIVITRKIQMTKSKDQIKSKTQNLYFSDSLEKAIQLAKNLQSIPGEIFIIGGASIYHQGLKYADKLYLTIVDKEYPDADAFFPDYSEFKITKEEKKSRKEYLYKFIEFIK